MKIVFVSVALNIHQVGIADQLYILTDKNFWFVETDNPSGNEKGGNKDFSSMPYLVRPYLSNDEYRKTLDIIHDADMMIYGPSNFFFFKERIKTGKLTFLYSERWFKRGWINIFSPRLIEQMFFYHTQCRDKPLFLLSSGGYTASDFSKMFAFRGKSFKWGYFTNVEKINIVELIQQKHYSDAKITRILWVGRFIPLKHAEQMVILADQLKSKGINFTITMVGSGPEEMKIKKSVIKKGLSEKFCFLGSIPNEEVRKVMKAHHIFCFTSNRLEGWGAVVNEAMSCGCCPVVSKDCGSASFLIKDGINGFIFDLFKSKDLFDKVYWLIRHPDRCEQMSIESYRTMYDIWSPHNAATRLVALSEMILSNKNCEELDLFKDGPCSKV